MRTGEETMRARIALTFSLVLALAGSAAASGMVVQTYSHPDLIDQGFGFRVADHDGDVLIGAPCSGPAREDFVYVFDAATGATKVVIPNPTGIGCQRFGQAVASDGAEIFVGSPFADGGDGAVYVFDGSTGALLRTFLPSGSLSFAWQFGWSLLIHGSELFVGAAGTDSPFSEGGAVVQLDRATGALLQTYNNPFGGGFDFADELALAGDRLLVTDDWVFGGVVEVFDVASGAAVGRMQPPPPNTSRGFGASVAVTNGRIAIGAPSGPGGGGPGSTAGAVYFYDAATLAFIDLVRAPDLSGDAQPNFGAALAVLGGDFLVTAPIAPLGNLNFNGATYLLDGSTGELRYRFHALGAGSDVAALGGRVLVGAQAIHGNTNAAYLFETCATLAEGAACDDGNACDSGDRCESGRCRAGTPIACEGEPGRCRLPGCDPATGTCNQRLALQGAPCFGPVDVCSRPDVCNGAGACTIDADPDPDGDRVCSFDDTCPNIANPGQEDADDDSHGDVCDSTDALLVLHDATVRASLGAIPKGKIKIRGELLSRADQLPLDATQGMTIQVRDQGSSFAEVFTWTPDECSGAAPARAGCRNRGRPASRIDLRPLARQVDGLVVYRVTFDASHLPVGELPVGPLAVTITSQPPRAVNGFDRAGLVTGCRPRGIRLRCDVGAGLP